MNFMPLIDFGLKHGTQVKTMAAKGGAADVVILDIA